MYIHIQNEVIEFKNDIQLIEEIFSTINNCLEKESLEFSHLIIDNNSIYDNFYDNFVQNIDNIQKVEVAIKTITDLVNDTLLSTFKYIENAMPLISELAEEFYQKTNEDTWSQLSDMLEGLQWIIETLTNIDEIKDLKTIVNDYSIWNEYVQAVSNLTNIVPELETAMIGKDIILIADILLYEMIAVFENMHAKLKFLVPRVVEKGVN
ncbi:hypothetical protein GC105_03100 [Alkalibaculum sp. M08DMB]|uniref:Uncharacterized protein n=1 Tax=Alkalibaculum sporogenes TaxID=2655001 RepID=A0A6A7K6D6_9FIRM|nr:hypothetical protein [Alkalibaculum sporogenes]MPW24777.1 hypothetical protein [Alkalibaculum sporogenes]